MPASKLRAASCRWLSSGTPRVQGSRGRQPRVPNVACLETSCKPGLYLSFCTASFQIACCLLQSAPKHHGSEGRIGPAAGSPKCQTSLSERLETSCKPGFYLPFCTASFQIACCVLQVAFVWHSSGPRTVPQHQNTMAVKDGSGPRPAAQSAKRCMPRN